MPKKKLKGTGLDAGYATSEVSLFPRTGTSFQYQPITSPDMLTREMGSKDNGTYFHSLA